MLPPLWNFHSRRLEELCESAALQGMSIARIREKEGKKTVRKGIELGHELQDTLCQTYFGTDACKDICGITLSPKYQALENR